MVQEALDGRHKVDPSGQIIKLPVAGCPWKEHLAQLEEEQHLGDTIKFCMYEVRLILAYQYLAVGCSQHVLRSADAWPVYLCHAYKLSLIEHEPFRGVSACNLEELPVCMDVCSKHETSVTPQATLIPACLHKP